TCFDSFEQAGAKRTAARKRPAAPTPASRSHQRRTEVRDESPKRLHPPVPRSVVAWPNVENACPMGDSDVRAALSRAMPGDIVICGWRMGTTAATWIGHYVSGGRYAVVHWECDDRRMPLTDDDNDEVYVEGTLPSDGLEVLRIQVVGLPSVAS